MPNRVATSLVILLVCSCGADRLYKNEPKLALDVAGLRFQETPVGGVHALSLAIHNAGLASLHVDADSLAAPFAVAVAALDVAPNDTTSLDVFFRPTGAALAQATLRLRSNDPTQASVEIPLSGVGAASVLTVNPATLNYGYLEVGGSLGVRVMVQNLGSADFSGRVRALLPGRPGQFAFGDRALTESIPLAVPLAAQEGFPVLYTGATVGSDEASLVIETCGDRCGLEVRLFGTTYGRQVELQPKRIDFGSIGTTGRKSQTLLLSNKTDQTLVVRGVESDIPEVSVDFGAPLPISLAPQSSLPLVATFEGKAVGLVHGSLRVRHNHEDLGRATVPISADVVRSVLSFQPSEIDFGSVQAAPTRRQALLVNSGAVSLNVTQLEISGDPAFRLDASQLPVQLGPGESMLASVILTPDAIRSYEGVLSIRTDDPAAGQEEIPLRGVRGEPACHVTVDRPLIDFGDAKDQGTMRQTITLSNAGPSPCTVIPYSATTGFSVSPSTPLSLPVGVPIAVEIQAAAETDTLLPESGHIHFHFEDPSTPSFSVQAEVVRRTCDDARSINARCRCHDGSVRGVGVTDEHGGFAVVPFDGGPLVQSRCVPPVQTCAAGDLPAAGWGQGFGGTCVPPPPTCGRSEVLQFRSGQWSCASSCSVVVLNRDSIQCASDPEKTCPGALLPVFDNNGSWLCDTDCHFEHFIVNGQSVCIGPC
ncbi:MAG: choice-of-anchor D domain-containing protein [Myxococcota bacterium]